jgi:hypothetical protein
VKRTFDEVLTGKSSVGTFVTRTSTVVFLQGRGRKVSTFDEQESGARETTYLVAECTRFLQAPLALALEDRRTLLHDGSEGTKPGRWKSRKGVRSARRALKEEKVSVRALAKTGNTGSVEFCFDVDLLEFLHDVEWESATKLRGGDGSSAARIRRKAGDGLREARRERRTSPRLVCFGKEGKEERETTNPSTHPECDFSTGVGARKTEGVPAIALNWNENKRASRQGECRRGKDEPSPDASNSSPQDWHSPPSFSTTYIGRTPPNRYPPEASG